MGACPAKNSKINTPQVEPDPVYSSRLVSKFINHMMSDGKKSTAQKILYAALETVGQKGGDEPLKLFKKAVDNVRPVGRGQVAPRWWFDVPGAGRGIPAPQDVAGVALAG